MLWSFLQSSSFGLSFRAQEVCESRGGRPGLPVPNRPYGLCGRKAALNLNLVFPSELRSCVKEEVDVLGSPFLIVRKISVDVKQQPTIVLP